MRPFASLTLLAAALAAAPAAATAQIDRESHELVGAKMLFQTDLAGVQTWTAQGYRLSNIEIISTQPDVLMNCTLVRNTGVYQANWWFYYDKSRTEVMGLCNNLNARIVDHERYLLNGVEKYAVILFQNSGQQSKAWHFLPQIPQGQILATVGAYNDRVIDLETYSVNGTRYYSCVTIHNTGSDYKPWWVYTGTTPTTLQNATQTAGRHVYDIEVESLIPYGVCGVVVQDDLRCKTLWNQFYGSGYHAHTDIGARITDIGLTGIASYAITVMDDFQPFQTQGIGCMGTNGLPYHTGSGTAITGSTLTYRVENVRAWAPTFMIYGLMPTAVELDQMGAPGCYVRVIPASTEFLFSNGNGVATTSIQIPNDPAFAGLPLLTQMAASDPGNNALGMVTSNRVQTTIRTW